MVPHKLSMASSKTQILLNLSIHFFSIFAIFSPANTFYCKAQEQENANIKGMFVFGSSLVDNGNNNFLENKAKANYLPYGIDFPLGPSGRFTNGKNVIDLLGDHLKIPVYIPAFADPTTHGNKTVFGVNFASGGSGILDETGSIVGYVMSMNEQIKNFEEITLPDLEEQVEGNTTSNNNMKLLGISDYLFVVGSGGNDYTLNYFLTKSDINITIQAFTANLTTTLSHQLMKLYGLGARKFVVMSVYPLGCSPGVIARLQPQRKGCIHFLNQAAHLFNIYLKFMVDEITPQLSGLNLVIVNAYKIIRDIIKNPASKGFSETSKACCEVLSLEEGGNGISCKRGGSICANRSMHLYFDGLHPTEAFNIELARKAFTSNSPAEVYPFNVEQLSLI